MTNLIGDSGTGKTWLALEMLAQCCEDSYFDKYKLIFDDAEHALSINVKKCFGSKLADRLEAPNEEDGIPCCSETIEDLHCNALRAFEDGPCIYVLDSFDALSSIEDDAKVTQMRAAIESGKEVAGSYGMSKPKKASAMFKDICGLLEKHNSFLLIISQTRDNINPMSFEKTTRSGGKALKFYASHEIWISSMKKLRAKERVVGSDIKAKVSKNKLTGLIREVQFPILTGYGVDDITACVAFLIKEGVIKGGGTSNCVWRDLTLKQAKLIKTIEEQELEQTLFEDVATTWLDIEESIRPKRVFKYED